MSKKEKRKRRIATIIATAVLLLICAGVIYGSSQSKDAINEWKKSYPNPTSSENLMFSILLFLPSIPVVIINMTLGFTIRKFAQLEMHKTYTDYDTSVMIKLTISMFLNTAVVAMAYHWGSWYEVGGLTVEVYNILIANAVVQPVLTLISPAWVMKKLKQCLALRRVENSLLSQQEAHDLFEGIPLDMAQRCAYFMKTYLLTILYAPILPLAYPIGVVALLLQYIVDKFMLLRVHARPDVLSDELDDAMLTFVALGTLLYAATNMLFYFDFRYTAAVPGIVGLVTAFAYNIFPIQKIVKVLKRHFSSKITEQVNMSESEKTYAEAMVDFVDDYDRCNPVTAEEGKRLWQEAIIRKKQAKNREVKDDSQAAVQVSDFTSQLLRRNLGLNGPKRKQTQGS